MGAWDSEAHLLFLLRWVLCLWPAGSRVPCTLRCRRRAHLRAVPSGRPAAWIFRGIGAGAQGFQCANVGHATVPLCGAAVTGEVASYVAAVVCACGPIATEGGTRAC